MSLSNLPRFVVIEVLCDELPSRHEQDIRVLEYLALQGLPAYEVKEYMDFQGIIDTHFLVYPETHSLEVCVIFKVVQNA